MPTDDTILDARRYAWLRSRYRALDFCYGREEDENGQNAGWPAVVLRVPDQSSWPAPWPSVPPEHFDTAVDRAMALEPLHCPGDENG